MLSNLIFLIGTSLSGVMAPGPMFAVTLARSQHSPWAGPLMALGHAVVEVPLILLIYFSFGRLFQENSVKLILSFIGGGVIIGMGVDMFRTRKKSAPEAKDVKGKTFTAGILMSGLNPFFLFWWATAGSLLISRFVSSGLPGIALLTVVHWSCDLVWLSFVSAVVYKTHNLWGKRVQEWLFIACAAFLVYHGVKFLISGLTMVI